MKADAVVVGGGIMGLATAYRLARSGSDVHVIEQFSLCHSRGSSHGRSRMLRLSYADPRYVGAAKASLRLWNEFEDTVDQRLFHRTGSLEIGVRGLTELDSIRAAMVATGTSYEYLDGKDVKARWPQFNVDERYAALFQADGGILDAELCLRTLAHEVERYGGSIHCGETVTNVRSSKTSVEITTNCDVYEADRTILCAGAWIHDLLHDTLSFDLPVFVSTEQVAFFPVTDEAAFAPSAFPIFVYYDGTPFKRSGFPLFNSPGLKLMIEQKQNRRYEGVDTGRLGALRDHAVALLNGVTGEAIGAHTCLYTMAADEDFIIDAIPGHERIVVVSPCSGHGFKFALLIGSYVANLLAGFKPSELDMFALRRFAEA